MFFSLTNRNVFMVFVTLTWERVIFIIVYVYPRKCLLRHILSKRSHIGVCNIFLKTLSKTMLILSPFTYVIYLTILMMSIGCMINYSCQHWIDMLPLKIKLWTHRFHTWTLPSEKPLIKEICGVANIFKTAMINSEWNMLCGGIVW